MSRLFEMPRCNYSNDDGDAHTITIGFLNNMPDSAFEQTERQFLGLVQTAASDVAVRVRLFSIPEISRSTYFRRKIAERYHTIGALSDCALHGLIVTGTEPLASNLKDEPYWDSLSQVVDWANDNTISTIWSCLAAHAAVLRTDGIQRRKLPEKLFGIFEFQSASTDAIEGAIGAGLHIPHSRYNGLQEDALKTCGYQILTRSEVAGVDMFARQDKSFHLFFHGHPEYEASTLLREYRREIERFLKGQRESYPAAPAGYFDDVAMTIVNAFREHAEADRRECLLAAFPINALAARLHNPWHDRAVAVYSNWIAKLKEEGERSADSTLRRSWRDRPLDATPPR